jgi:hypothetical protein
MKILKRLKCFLRGYHIFKKFEWNGEVKFVKCDCGAWEEWED